LGRKRNGGAKDRRGRNLISRKTSQVDLRLHLDSISALLRCQQDRQESLLRSLCLSLLILCTQRSFKSAKEEERSSISVAVVRFLLSFHSPPSSLLTHLSSHSVAGKDLLQLIKDGVPASNLVGMDKEAGVSSRLSALLFPFLHALKLTRRSSPFSSSRTSYRPTRDAKGSPRLSSSSQGTSRLSFLARIKRTTLVLILGSPATEGASPSSFATLVTSTLS